MNTPRFWWMVVGACALACETVDDSEDNEAPIVDDDGICVTEEGFCEPDDLTLAAVHEGPCGSHPTASEVAVMEHDFAERLAAAPPQSRILVSVPLYVHVISLDGSSGNVSDARITNQITVLNERFAGTGFSFYVKELDRTVNSNWYKLTMDSDVEQQMKSALRKGGRADLNLYLVDCQGGYLGWSAFPWNSLFGLTDDGIVLDNITLPGGSSTRFGKGITLVHEVGHWLGLYHTFQSGCGWFGDYVSDTPAAKAPNYYCPEGSNTCSASGLDPIHNYMDYTDDACRSEFTTNQKSRMASQYSSFRG